jgi:D-3-phosphoglycerate dehydrogenase
MKEGVRIINCARGGLVDEEVLYKKLKEGKVAGAALDVFEQKKPFDSPLLELENCITVPHLGASTFEAQANVALEMANQVIDALHGGPIRNALNIPQVPPEVLQEIQPFLSLAEKLGSIHAQLAEGRIERMSIEYCGEITREDVTAITVACVKGMIEGVLQDAVVNYVNASYLAKERGIDVLESKVGEKSDFVNLISVKVKTEKEERLIAGTLFQRDDPRIVYIDNFRIDAVPAGHLLILTQTDEPGIIGNVGTILGKRGVNIGWLQLAREAIGGKAMSVWNVDAPISQEILQEIISLREVLSAKLVVL